jgi:hypothetical protein
MMMNNDLESLRKEAIVALSRLYIEICVEGLNKTKRNLGLYSLL